MFETLLEACSNVADEHEALTVFASVIFVVIAIAVLLFTPLWVLLMGLIIAGVVVVIKFVSEVLKACAEIQDRENRYKEIRDGR